MEMLGKADASVFMKIQYCGGWGYRPRCVALIEKLDGAMPNTFQYQLSRDAGRTGNFEIWVHKTEDLSDEGKFVYSKQKSGKFPTDDAEWENFVVEVTAAMKWAIDWHMQFEWLEKWSKWYFEWWSLQDK